MVLYFAFLLFTYITLIVNILQELIKILLEKMLKAINLYRSHNDTSEFNK